jgi:hypothetical protein
MGIFENIPFRKLRRIAPSQFCAMKNCTYKILVETNNCVESMQFNATPDETKCRYCLYRSACSFYLRHLETVASYNDLNGLIIDVIRYQNGNISTTLDKMNNKFVITGLPNNQYEFFNTKKDKQLAFFNLRKEMGEFVYSATKMTKVYEQ